jgi:hypothetical protein
VGLRDFATSAGVPRKRPYRAAALSSARRSSGPSRLNSVGLIVAPRFSIERCQVPTTTPSRTMSGLSTPPPEFTLTLYLGSMM